MSLYDLWRYCTVHMYISLKLELHFFNSTPVKYTKISMVKYTGITIYAYIITFTQANEDDHPYHHQIERHLGEKVSVVRSI